MGGDGYPNAQQTLNTLRYGLHIQIIECGAWLPKSMHLWRLDKASYQTKAIALTRLLFGNLWSVFCVLRKQRPKHTSIYLPYPAIFFLWWSSWIPMRWRPRCIVDAYISIWDSKYRDRSKGAPSSLAAEILKSFESRALQTAKLVLVDTVANKQMYINEFKLGEQAIAAIPLAIEEDQFLRCTNKIKNQDKSITVLFVGTLIPLHGVETILEAIKLLLPDQRFRFHLLGDGQLGPIVKNYSYMFEEERFKWTQEWVDLQRIADEIDRADICLGVFGGDGKAARVLPFKIYMYLASGKAIVTQSSFSLPENTPPPPMVTVAGANVSDLVSAITRLAGDEALRNKMGSEARAYYIQHLGHERLAKEWRNLLARYNEE